MPALSHDRKRVSFLQKISHLATIPHYQNPFYPTVTVRWMHLPLIYTQPAISNIPGTLKALA